MAWVNHPDCPSHLKLVTLGGTTEKCPNDRYGGRLSHGLPSTPHATRLSRLALTPACVQHLVPSVARSLDCSSDRGQDRSDYEQQRYHTEHGG
jgi:hypothetical protein